MPVIQHGTLVKKALPSNNAVAFCELAKATNSNTQAKAVVFADDDLIINEAALPDLKKLANHAKLIVIAITSPADGRGFSLAHIIRRDAAYKGELRAKGHIIPDQYAFAVECGFDSVEITSEQLLRQPILQWQKAFYDITLRYRPKGQGKRHTINDLT